MAVGTPRNRFLETSFLLWSALFVCEGFVVHCVEYQGALMWCIVAQAMVLQFYFNQGMLETIAHLVPCLCAGSILAQSLDVIAVYLLFSIVLCPFLAPFTIIKKSS